MATSDLWSPPPTSFELADDEVHVWRASLPAGVLLEQFGSLLSSEEKERAGKFLVKHAKEQFVASRGILRELLSAYSGVPAANISFTYSPYGKPAVSGCASASFLRFNASHSHGYGAFAFARKREVGIDVEQTRSDIATEEIAERFFSKAEIKELTTLPPESRTQGFFKCWTRKEAYIKAQGLGLQIPLRSFDVSIETGAPQQIRDGNGVPWSLYSFEPQSGFVGAVAAEGTGWRLRLFDWQMRGV